MNELMTEWMNEQQSHLWDKCTNNAYAAYDQHMYRAVTLTWSWSATPQYSKPCSRARNSPTGSAKLPKCSDSMDLERDILHGRIRCPVLGRSCTVMVWLHMGTLSFWENGELSYCWYFATKKLYPCTVPFEHTFLHANHWCKGAEPGIGSKLGARQQPDQAGYFPTDGW